MPRSKVGWNGDTRRWQGVNDVPVFYCRLVISFGNLLQVEKHLSDTPQADGNPVKPRQPASRGGARDNKCLNG